MKLRRLSRLELKCGELAVLELTQEHVILCEGLADQNFLRKFQEKRQGIPAFDMLPHHEHYGSTNFDRMLLALRGDKVGFEKLRGVLIVADSHDDPDVTFKSIKEQIQKVGQYPVPNQKAEIAPRTANHPAICVMLLPDDETPGGLETLCFRYLTREPHAWIKACIESFLCCDKIEAHSWGPETLDKARYECAVAATCKADPSRSVSQAFKDPHPIITVTDTCFDDLERRLKLLFAGT